MFLHTKNLFSYDSLVAVFLDAGEDGRGLFPS